MKGSAHSLLIPTLLVLIWLPDLLSQKMPMPKEDVIEVPAIGDGLCVHNLFQSNMILQRDKPIEIWGWAKPGEVVRVLFAGKSKEAKAGKDREWKVTLPAMTANADPQTLNIKGKDQNLTLENVLIGDVWVLGGQSNMEDLSITSRTGNWKSSPPIIPESAFLRYPLRMVLTQKRALPVCMSGAVGRTDIFVKETGTSVRPKSPVSYPPSDMSSLDAFTWRRKFPSA